MKRIVVGVLAAAGLLAGCGPIESVAVIDDAQVALTGAKAANGDRYAPYEYTSAELYLDKAREERGHAEYQQAIGYARQAREMAREAESKSMKATQQRGTTPPTAPWCPTRGATPPRLRLRRPRRRRARTANPRPRQSRSWPPRPDAQEPRKPMATARSLALTALAGVFLFAGCVTGGQLRATAGVVQENLKLARKQGAMKCAPRQLARGEAHLTFALGELDQGDWQRAQQELDLAQTSTRKAVRLSRGCIKQVLIKKPKPPPVIVRSRRRTPTATGSPTTRTSAPSSPAPVEPGLPGGQAQGHRRRRAHR